MVPAAILAQQRAAGNRAVAGVLGGAAGRNGSLVARHEPVVQRASLLTALPPELSFDILSTISWRDFVQLRAVSRAHRDWVDRAVTQGYGGWTPENMLAFWLVDLRRVHQLTLFGIVDLAKSMGTQALWPAFWRAVAQVHVPSKANADNVDILLAIGQKYGLAGSLDFIGAVVELAYSAGFNHLSLCTSYLDALERSDSANIGAPEAKVRRTEIERGLDIELGTVDKKGDVYFDAPLSSAVPGGEGDEYLETSDVVLRRLRQDAEETDNRQSKVLANRLAMELRNLDAILGKHRGRPSRADTPVPLLRYVQRALAQAEWETLTALHTALTQPPSVSITYKGDCRAGIVGATDLLEALRTLLRAVDAARVNTTVKGEEKAKKNVNLGEKIHQKEARERRERRSLRTAKSVEDEKAGMPKASPEPMPSRDPDEDERTGEERNLTYRGMQYFRFKSKCYGRVDRDKLARDCTDEQLRAFEAAIRSGLAPRIGGSGVKQRGEYYQVKLSDADARKVGFRGSAEARLRSALAIVDTPEDRHRIKYFVFDRMEEAHSGGHI